MPTRKLLLILTLTAVIVFLSWILYEEKNLSNVEAQDVCARIAGGKYNELQGFKNPYTGELNCPTGYKSYLFHFACGSMAGCSSLYQCAP